MRILWNLMPPNNIWDKRDLREDETYSTEEKKKLNIMTVKKIDISNEIVNNNNNSHSNIFRKLYRLLRRTLISICDDQIC